MKNLCEHSNLTPLQYIYDDGWSTSGSEVWWQRKDGKEQKCQLMVCQNCGIVFAVPVPDKNSLKN